MLPFAGYHCQYAGGWVADKTRYQLSVGPDEKAALSQILSNCPDSPIEITLVH
ncbi:hypothetical protein ABT119_35400 [Streptomyces sp. NPDC001910]|uniref:hypothetical protein n=1 Tax=Streptomyces sp. NPDC001910 TaxID=3154403 RepID=UPI003318CA13